MKTRKVKTASTTRVIYPRKAMKVVCPVHGETWVEAIIACGIRLGCGCAWCSGGGILDGWYREEDAA